MEIESNGFYANDPTRRLFAHELAALAPILNGVYGNFGLLLRAGTAMPATLPEHLLGAIIDLQLCNPNQLRGSLACAPNELPLASESCKLVVAQHVFEHVDCAEDCVSEFARVLAPEGVALILGFNALSPWQTWLNGKARSSRWRLRQFSALACQQMLNRHGIEALQTRRIGTVMPWSANNATDIDAPASRRAALLDPIRSSWLLLARKRRSALTPLRMRRKSGDRALNPRFVPDARRECA